MGRKRRPKLGTEVIEEIMAVTTSSSVSGVVNVERRRPRRFKLTLGGTTMAMRGGRKKKDKDKKKRGGRKSTRGGRRR